MSWQGIEGHDLIAAQFGAAIRADRLASTYLFVGPPGVGKRSFALRLAAGMLCLSPRDESTSMIDADCERGDESQTELSGISAPAACGECESCRLAAAGNHPDLEQVAKPADKSFIPVATFIGDDTHRMREGLCHWISLKPFLSRRKIAIIDDADYLNEEGANALLKTLEEPPPRSLLMLIGTSLDRQLPTIRSRCQIVRFRPLGDEVVARLLMALQVVDQAPDAVRLAALAEGSLARAMELADSELRAFRALFLQRLADSPLDAVGLAKQVLAIVETAGKESAAKRQRIQVILRFAVDFYRQLMRLSVGLPPTGDGELTRAASQAATRPLPSPECLGNCLERTVVAQGHVDRNAHHANLVECWLGDLARLLAGQRVVFDG